MFEVGQNLPFSLESRHSEAGIVTTAQNLDGHQLLEVIVSSSSTIDRSHSPLVDLIDDLIGSDTPTAPRTQWARVGRLDAGCSGWFLQKITCSLIGKDQGFDVTPDC